MFTPIQIVQQNASESTASIRSFSEDGEKLGIKVSAAESNINSSQLIKSDDALLAPSDSASSAALVHIECSAQDEAARLAAKRLLIQHRVAERRLQMAIEKQASQYGISTNPAEAKASNDAKFHHARSIREQPPLSPQPGPNHRVQSPKLNSAPPQQNLMSEALVLFISGATGIHAAGINGVYDRTSETSGGYALYRKRGDGSVCMEHHGGDWEVKLVANKGKDGCYAWVAGGCAAEACTSRQWTVWDGKAWQDAPLVKMVAGAEAERQVGCCRLHAPPPLPTCALLPLTCVCFCAGR
jgi:hypothetical protein